MSSKRSRKRNDNLPPNPAHNNQCAYRARREAHLEALQQRISEMEEENAQLCWALKLPPANRPPMEEMEKGSGLRNQIGISNTRVTLVDKSGFDESQNQAFNVGPPHPTWLDPSPTCSGGDQLVMETHIRPAGTELTMTLSRNDLSFLAVDKHPAKSRMFLRTPPPSNVAKPYQCSSCNATQSPEWRKGPCGNKELCNAYVTLALPSL
ncbi:hypothetical protein B0H13DRAFT_2339141 [Mycena leptocephala]|nr:hypothetical protein B0H13DRAFT_2339141 [Mycena leptocephala]